MVRDGRDGQVPAGLLPLKMTHSLLVQTGLPTQTGSHAMSVTCVQKHLWQCAAQGVPPEHTVRSCLPSVVVTACAFKQTALHSLMASCHDSLCAQVAPLQPRSALQLLERRVELIWHCAALWLACY